MDKYNIKDLNKKIAAAKRELESLGDMRPGSLSRQHRGSKGKYWHLSYTHEGKGCTEYIKEDAHEKVRLEISNFKRFKKIVDRLIGLSIKLSKAKIQLAKHEKNNLS